MTLSAFVAYRHTGADPEELRPMLETVCSALRARGVDTYCTFFSEERFRAESLTPRQILEHAFREIAQRDFLLIVQASPEKSEGMLMEVGFVYGLRYCWESKKKIVVAVRDGIGSTYVPEMADLSFGWRDLEELERRMRDIDFADLKH